jgi:hypothetical protein
MSVCRAKETALPSKLSWRLAISLAGALLLAAIPLAPSASAASLGSATDGVGAVASEVTGVDLPSLPGSVPQQPSGANPPAPVATPDPRVPTVSVPTPTGRPSSSHSAPPSSSGSAQVPGPGVGMPSPEAVTGAANGALGTAAPGVRQATAPAGGGAEGADKTASAGGGEGADSPGGSRSRIGGGSVGAAHGAPLGLLRAYVWPAVALGPAGELLTRILMAGEIVTGPTLSRASRLFLGSLRDTGADLAAGPAESSVALNRPAEGSRSLSLPSDTQMSLLAFIGLCAALAGSLIWTVRRELRSMHRWPL